VDLSVQFLNPGDWLYTLLQVLNQVQSALKPFDGFYTRIWITLVFRSDIISGFPAPRGNITTLPA